MNDAMCPGEERFLKRSKALPEETMRQIIETRARRLLGRRIEAVQSDSERDSLERELHEHFEKIHRGADFLPASFLSEGSRCARAVCRIETRDSLGTGFLIAPGVLITNNHVLEDEHQAAEASARFEYDADSESFAVSLLPDELFITDVDLDFTIVACVAESLADFPTIPLRRSPAGVARGERVSVIQHPRGRLKEVALHENRVVEIRDRVLRYRTDTEPGSSGSPVFNHQWELVGLHHAGVKSGETASNEGILVSAIVDHLLRQEESAHRGNEAMQGLLDSIPDSSPFLGFFDSTGLTPKHDHEVVVDAFVGNQEFADIGFWNIEHFNSRISDRRVHDVAGVLHRLNMDIMGLTEVEEGALNRLVGELSDLGMDADFVVEDVRGGQDIAALYDRSTTTVRRRRDLNDRHRRRLDATTAQGRSAFPRHPLFAHCRVKPHVGDEVEFLMIVVHLKAFGDAQSRARRRLAAEMLDEIIEDIRENESLPVVLGGDFNELLSNDVLSSLHDSPDMFALTADDASGSDPGAISFVGRRHRSLIDHIVVSSDVGLGQIQGDDAAIVRLDRTVSSFADHISDHVPVVVRLVMRADPIDVPDDGHDEKYVVEVPEGTRYVVFESNL